MLIFAWVELICFTVASMELTYQFYILQIQHIAETFISHTFIDLHISISMPALYSGVIILKELQSVGLKYSF